MTTQIIIEDKGLKEFQNRFNLIAQNIDNTTPLMKLIGVKIYKWIMNNFNTEGNPVGGWKELSPATIMGRRKEGKGAKILKDTGLLRDSFNFQANKDVVRIGSPEMKAIWHHFGTKRIPKRPIFPPDKIAIEIAIKEAEDFIKRNIKIGGTI